LVTTTAAPGSDPACASGAGKFAIALYAGRSTFTSDDPSGSGIDTCTQQYQGCALSRTCENFEHQTASTLLVTFAPDGTLTGTFTLDPTAGGCAYSLAGGDCY
jgi:hypothetical protein